MRRKNLLLASTSFMLIALSFSPQSTASSLEALSAEVSDFSEGEEIAVPYHGTIERPLPAASTVLACPVRAISSLVSVSCLGGTITIVGLGFDQNVVPFELEIHLTLNTGTDAHQLYRVTLQPPTIPTADPVNYPFLFSQGAQVLIPFSDLPSLCEGCEKGKLPRYSAVSVSPALSGKLSISTVGLEFLPAPDFVGLVTVTYCITDPFAQVSAPVPLSFTLVSAPASLPIATRDFMAAAYEQAVTINLLHNDYDPAGGLLTLLSCAQPMHGAVTCSPDGTASYIPEPTFSGVDQFSYRVGNSAGGQTIGTAAITVEGSKKSKDFRQVERVLLPTKISTLSQTGNQNFLGLYEIFAAFLLLFLGASGVLRSHSRMRK